MDGIKEQLVSRDMVIQEVIMRYPYLAEVMESFGLSCVGCHANVSDSVYEGAKAHGMEDGKIEAMIEKLNEEASKKGPMDAVPPGPVELRLAVTDKAAGKITEILSQQGKAGWALRLGVIPGGCSGYTYEMDFSNQAAESDIVLEQKGVKFFVNSASARLINGAEIDYIDSLQGAGFKINNPNAKSSCGCGKSFG